MNKISKFDLNINSLNSLAENLQCIEISSSAWQDNPQNQKYMHLEIKGEDSLNSPPSNPQFIEIHNKHGLDNPQNKQDMRVLFNTSKFTELTS